MTWVGTYEGLRLSKVDAFSALLGPFARDLVSRLQNTCRV